MRPLKPLPLLLTASILTGCSNQVSPGNDLTIAEKNSIQQCINNLPASKKIKLQAVSTSCITTFAISKAIGQNNPAALICMAGGTAGFMLGKSVAERKCSYISAEKQIQSELTHAKKINSNFSNLFIEQEKNIRGLDARAVYLLNQQHQGHNKQQELLQLQQQLKKSIAKENTLLQQLTEDVQIKSQTINIASKKSTRDNQENLLTEVKSLQKSILRMRTNQNTLKKINYLVTTSIKPSTYQ